MKTRWIYFICGTLLAGELALGIYMSVHNGFMNGDALSRLANAYYVLFSRDPHLTAMGFVWNPLPSFLVLPLLLLKPLFPALTTSGIAIIILSAIFAMMTALLLLKRFSTLSTPLRITGIICVLLFVFHPFQFLYGANGMSEVIFSFWLIFSILNWTAWLSTGRIKPLILASLALAFAFLTRYEAIPFTAAMFIASMVFLNQRKAKLSTLESTGIILLLPALFAVAVWIWLNYTIMGDALYFLRSSYSNLGQSAMLEDNDILAKVIGNPLASLWYVIERTAVFMIPYAGVLLCRINTRTLLRADFLGLTLLVLSIPVFQWYMILTGSSYGWLRFFYYPLIIVIAWLPYELSLSDYRNKMKTMGFKIVLVCSFLASALLVLPMMNHPVYGPEEYVTIHYQESENYKNKIINLANAQTLDHEIFEHDPGALILTDSFNAFEVLLYSQYPERFVSTTDRDFNEVLEDPLAYGIEYILVPVPEGLNLLNAVLTRYPGIYEERHAWVKLEMELEGHWRLFQVIDQPLDIQFSFGGERLS